jgi:DNA repair photolyase
MANNFSNDRTGTGTREWSEYSMNIGLGCRNKCRYCYATIHALRYKRIANRDEWENETVRDNAFPNGMGKRVGVIMFPTIHDITPTYLEKSIDVLVKTLKNANNVLIVSKPRIDCIAPLLIALEPFKEQVLFRFTIGTLDNELSKFWEPGAPLPNERIECLKLTYESGFKTSVSMEPMLSGKEDAIKTFEAVEPYVTDKIWLGKMNKINQRVLMDDESVAVAVQKIKDLQSDSEVATLYNALKDNPKAEWKDSVKQVVGIVPA